MYSTDYLMDKNNMDMDSVQSNNLTVGYIVLGKIFCIYNSQVFLNIGQLTYYAVYFVVIFIF